MEKRDDYDYDDELSIYSLAGLLTLEEKISGIDTDTGSSMRISVDYEHEHENSA